MSWPDSKDPMRIATLLAVLFSLATSSTALAATKAMKFGKLVDGTGRVFTNGVVVVEDDRGQRVAGGNPPIPSGAEVSDLSRYTGIPGLIDAHTGRVAAPTAVSLFLHWRQTPTAVRRARAQTKTPRSWAA